MSVLSESYLMNTIINTCPIASRHKTAIRQAEKEPKLPRTGMFWAECNSPLFNRVAGQVEVPAGQVNFSFPRCAKKCFRT